MNIHDYWKDYKRHTGSLVWRLATEKDLPAIAELRDASERATQEPQRNLNLFGMPVILALIAEDESGHITECLYLEAEVELIKVGCSSETFKEIGELQDDLAGWLRQMGIKRALATTLQRHKDKMADGLKDLAFDCMDEAFSFWRRQI